MNKQEKALELLELLKEREIGVVIFYIEMENIFGKESKEFKEFEKLTKKIVEINDYHKIAEKIIKGH